MRKSILCVSMMALTLSAYSQQKQKKDTVKPIKLSEVVIESQTLFPDKKINKRASSHIYVTKKELRKYNYTDVNRVIAGKTGIHYVEEDGWGLRPNIIIRGAAGYRSSKVNLMEDGVLIAPAPYASPAAYYFPTIGRMSGVEVLKGSGQIHYGPNTIGGTFNMISTQVPKDLKLNLNASYGAFDSYKVHAVAGDRIGKFGYMVEYFSNNSKKGFKELPNGKSTGFNIDDGVVKLLYDNSDATMPNKLQLKLQFSGETSNETYMGLTREDFKKNAFQRYLASELDQMVNSHKQFILSYEIKPSDNLKLNLDLYRNDFARNWYKVNNVTAGGKKASLTKALGMNNNSNEVKALKGLYEGDNTIFVRHNNRVYRSQGIQLNGKYNVGSQGKLLFGSRYHTDDQDRIQADDQYSSTKDGLSLKSKGKKGTQSNRYDFAKAWASYAQYQHDFGNLVATLGLRYEKIDMERKDYGKKDPNRTKNSDFKNVKNDINVLIPGISLLYKVSEEANVFASVHRGFAPSGFKKDQKAEKSTNYEFGGRINNNFVDAELVGYINNYSNMLGTDSNAVGGTSGTGDLFNAGEVLIKGLETQIRYTINGKDSDIRFPIGLSYTLFTSKFKKDFKSTLYRGKEVKKGDELPYTPKHQLNIEASAEIGKFAINATYKFRGDFRNSPGQGKIEEKDLVPAVGIMDFSASYSFNNHLKGFVTAQNLFNKTYLANLTPAGLRPGIPRFMAVGINIEL